MGNVLMVSISFCGGRILSTPFCFKHPFGVKFVRTVEDPSEESNKGTTPEGVNQGNATQSDGGGNSDVQGLDSVSIHQIRYIYGNHTNNLAFIRLF